MCMAGAIYACLLLDKQITLTPTIKGMHTCKYMYG
jgi:hypothetical protein